MNLHIKNLREASCVCDALILPVTEGKTGLFNSLSPSIPRLLERISPKEFRGKQNEVLFVPAPPDMKPGMLLFIGLGKKEEVSPEVGRQAGGKAGVYLRDMGMKKISLSTLSFRSLKASPADLVEGLLLATYVFKKYVKQNAGREIGSLIVLAKDSKALKGDLRWSQIVASSVNFTRDLINTPANDMTPGHLAQAALSLRGKKLSVKVLEKKDARRLGMGCYLSVSSGSDNPPKFIVLKYQGSKETPLILIGKSITFDSGGLSLKPADGMEKMKYDMAGGGAVLGVFKAVSELKLPVSLVGILPATENVVGGSATRPGDVVKAIGGKTVEIISTDAEGRMTLADAIGYARRLKPRVIIDIATLTGACSIALGNGAIAMMGNDKKWVAKIKKSGDNTYERVWEMPLFDEYKEYLKSDIADLKNTGGRSGSLVSSGCFLREFAGDTPWVHLDIAGTAWAEKEKPYIPKGASGIGVRLLMNLIKELE
jgi:leucyl aminopeptidase